MASNYGSFPVNYSFRPGHIIAMPGATVKVYVADDPAADILSGASNGLDGSTIATLTADIDGMIAAGTLPVDAGTLVRFRVENYFGIAWSKHEVTT